MNKSGNKKILIVDDESCIRNICKDVLVTSGYETCEAENGEAAFEKINQDTFELVVSDVRMPVMDGIMLYKQAIKAHEYLRGRFLFITGDVNEELLLTFTQMELKYLWKPFKIIDLVNCVDAMTMRSHPDNAGERLSFIRQEARIPLSGDCDVTMIDGRKIGKAHAVDLSKSGIRLSYQGAPLVRAAIVNINLQLSGLSMRRRGTVVWSRAIDNHNALAGLRVREALPVELLTDIFQFYGHDMRESMSCEVNMSM